MSGAAIALAAGLALGAAYFWGLWWTVRRGLTAANPALWFGISALLRLGALLTGLYFIGRAGWLSLVLMLGGILIARAWVTRAARTAA